MEAAVSNEDLAATFEFIKVGTDGYGAPINDLAFTLRIKHVTGSGGYSRIIVDDTLTAQERTSLNQLLVKLRDAALDAAGYLDT